MTKKSSKNKIKKKSKKSSNNDDNDNDNHSNSNDEKDENEKLSKKVLRIQKNYITNTTKSFIQNNGVVALSSAY
jgi:hypothetical protein